MTHRTFFILLAIIPPNVATAAIADTSLQTTTRFSLQFSAARMNTNFLLSKACRGEEAQCSLMRCALLCSTTSSCLSYSFGHVAKGCGLYNAKASSEESLKMKISEEGWVTFDKEEEAAAETKVSDKSTSDLPKDCTTKSTDGDYYIYPYGNSTQTKAHCQTHGGHMWTVIDRRVDDSLSFVRKTDDFVTYFGSVDDNYWIGFDVIRALTSSKSYNLLALVKTSSGTYDALYSGFSIDDAPDYTLRYQAYVNGTAGDALFNFKDRHFGGRGSCTGCAGWWVEINDCCGDHPHSPMNGEAVWASDEDHYLTGFVMMIREA